MNLRERWLAGLLAGVLVLGGVWMVVQWGVIARWQNLHKNIALAIQKKGELHARLESARRSEERWGALTPLAHNADLAQQRFRDDLSQLLERHGLGADCTIRAQPQRKLKSGFTEARLMINARGSLRQVLNFLLDFYRRQYLARIDQLGLLAEDQGRPGRAGRAGRAGSDSTPGTPADPEGPKLTLTMTASALVLPEITVGGKKIPQQAATTLEPSDDSAPTRRRLRPRPEYDLVVDKNLFKEWQPEQPKPSQITHAPSSAPVTAAPIVTGPPPVTRPQKRLAAVMSTFGELCAYVRDETKRELPPEKIDLNDPVDDGTLVLVVPRGMVVQVPAPAAEAPTFKYYFYKLGKSFGEREELDAAKHADIKQKLEAALTPP